MPVVDELGVQEFIDTFTDEPVLRTYPIHVQGHPVGSALLFAGLDRIGLGGSAGGAAFVLVVSASAFAAVLLAVREVGGEARARRVAPFLALAPAMVWWVTSGGALFATAGAWGTALMVLATAAGSSGRRRALLGIGSGLVWALGLHLSYGLVPLALVGTVVVVARRRWEVIGWAALGGVAMTVPWVLAGFWWFDGLAATRIRYEAGIARIRPYGHFSRIGNPAAFGLAIGPAAWVAVARARQGPAHPRVVRADRCVGRQRVGPVEGRGRTHLVALRHLGPRAPCGPGRHRSVPPRGSRRRVRRGG